MNDLIHAEDIVPGTRLDLGEDALTLEDVVEFSRRWDPQEFHTSETGSGFFGGPIASGLQSLAVLQRLSVLGAYRTWAVLAGRRIRDVQFLAPVRPGVTLRGWLVVEDVEPRPGGRALVTTSKGLLAGDTVALTAVHELYVFFRSMRD